MTANSTSDVNAFSTQERADVLRGLYLGLLSREPDAAGLVHWLSAWESGLPLEQIVGAILGSAESRDGPVAARRRARDAARRALEAAVPALGNVLSEQPLVVVDIGAQNLENEDHVYAGLGRRGLPVRVIGFEPLEHRRQERLGAASAPIELLPAFVGDGGTHVFHLNEPDATSSLLPFNETVVRRLHGLHDLRTVTTEPAATLTLDTALAAEPHVDFLKLDIQGFELRALRHATAVLARTQVIHCEVSFVEIYRDQALFSEVESFLRSQGFELIDLSPLCRYPLTGNPHEVSADWLGWADAVFFRSPRTDEPWRDRLVRSLVALVVYGKPSLAAWLAESLAGTPAQAYRTALLAED
jgi:FkbM family methyltransferase